jgi:tRNA(Ile)-lysidine synthase
MLMNVFSSAKLSQIISSLISSKKVYVAYSGGVDSHVLLHSLCALNSDVEIIAIHIDHGLNPNSWMWVQHCEEICKKLKVKLLTTKVDVKAHLDTKHSMEEVARTLRYQAFSNLMPVNSVLLTAHHADDQAETLLLQLLRGAGPKGLAAMPMKNSLGKDKTLLRPLLQFTRAELLQYAREYNLQWIEDESNVDTNIDRNYLRQIIMPPLKEHWPSATTTINRVAHHCAEASHLLDVLASHDYLVAQGSVVDTLSVTKVLQLDEARQRNLIRYWLRQLNLSLPSLIKLTQLQHDVLHCHADANPLIHWEGVEVRRYQDDIYAMTPLLPHDPQMIIFWNLAEPLQLPNNLGILRAEFYSAADIDRTKITVRFRHGGEVCKPSGLDGHTHELKKLFQEWQIPPWQRDRVPLLYYGEELVAVIGYCVCDGWEDKVRITNDA